MLQKIYLKPEGRKATYFYIESKNFQFNNDKVFDKHFQKINIDKRIFENSKELILHNFRYPEETTFIGDDYDLALGSLIETPKELIQ